MASFPRSLRDWNTDSFIETLKQEVASVAAGTLPLVDCTSQGGQIDANDISITILRMAEEQAAILVDIGVFLTEIVGGCSCGDEPYVQNSYCEMQFHIDKATAEGRFSAIAD